MGALLRGESGESPNANGKNPPRGAKGRFAARTEQTDDPLAALAETPEKAADAAVGESPQKPAPKTIADLAERLGVPIEALYAITFPDGESGESRTLGQLKDMLAEQADHKARSLEFEETRVRSENELMRARQDLQTILQSLPKDALKPEVLERARAESEAHREREGARTLDVIPVWKDEKVREADHAAMVKHLAPYGFPASMLDATVDHRMLKYIRDNWQREDRVNKALAGVKERKATAPARTSTPAPAAKPAPKIGPNATQGEKVAAIGQLLRGG